MLLLLLVGCRVVDAPDTIEELMIFGFVNHGQEDEAFPQAFVEGLLPLAAQNKKDLEAGYRVDSISREDVEATGVTPPESVDITGVATQTHFESELSEVVDIFSSPDPGEVFAAVEEFKILESGDRACFLAGDCAFYKYSAHRVLNVPLLGKATQDFSGSFRAVEVEDVGRVVLWRTLAPEEATTDGALAVHQQYSMDLFVPSSEGGTERLSAIWLDAALNGEPLEDGLLIGVSVNQLKSAATDVDDFLAR